MSILRTQAMPNYVSIRFVFAMAIALSVSVYTANNAAADGTTQVKHRTVEIDGQTIFYREAGPTDAPTILLLHGFPTSSHMFRNLIPSLADKYHLVAPDYPGYGNSSMPRSMSSITLSITSHK
jgi:hypothetical protein